MATDQLKVDSSKPSSWKPMDYKASQAATKKAISKKEIASTKASQKASAKGLLASKGKLSAENANALRSIAGLNKSAKDPAGRKKGDTQGMSWNDYIQSGTIDRHKPVPPAAEKGLYDDLIAQLQSRLASDPAMIQSIYRNLADQIAAREAGVASRYDEAAQMLSRTGNQGTAATNAMYQAVRDAANQQRQTLGIQDAANVTGNALESQQQQAGNFIQQLLANEQARNVGYRQSAMTANQGAVLGSQAQGAAAAAQRARAIQDQIAQLGIQNTQYANQLEIDRANAAAAQAQAEAKAGTPVDFSAVLDAVLQRYPDIDPKQAIDIAQSQVKYG